MISSYKSNPLKKLLWLSVLVAVLTITIKTYAWYLTDSVGLLSDAMESFVNLASAVFALLMVSVAETPADEDHPYGHHKAEYFSSGFEGVLIMGAAIGIIWAAISRFMSPKPVEALSVGIALAVLSSAMNAALAYVMFKVAKEHRSIALEADARHLVVDVWTSAGVVIGLLAVYLTGWYALDPCIAILIAINILREGVDLIWQSSSGLMDEAVEPEVKAQIEAVLAEFSNYQGVQQNLRFDHITTRRAGQRRFVDMHMHMPGEWTLEQAATLRGNVEKSLMSAVPGLRASIQLLPSGVEAHVDSHETIALDPNL
jgi:cation diffusion facilitator family transporter